MLLIPVSELAIIKAVKKDKALPEGGVWRTIKGHKVYIKDGEILAGHIPGVTDRVDFKKLVKKHTSEVKKSEPKKKEEPAKPVKKTTPAKKTAPKATDTKATDKKKKEAEEKPVKKTAPKATDKKKKEAEEKPVKKTAPKKTKEVADIRTDKQTNNSVAYDVGEKVGGARKDTAIENFRDNTTGQSLEELEKISPELAQKYCVKSNILKPLDWEQEYKKGTDINVAMAKKLIYDRIATKPLEDTPESRAQYLSAIRELQRALEPIRTLDEFKAAIEYLGDHMKHETRKYASSTARSIEYLTKKLSEPINPSELVKTDYKNWNEKTRTFGTYKITEKELRAEQKATLAKYTAEMAKAYEAQKKPYGALGEKLTNFFTDSDSRNKTMDTIRQKKLDWATYFTGMLEGENGSKPKKASNKQKWEKEMPSVITRTGGRATKVKKPEDMIKTFGLRGVEFGNWVDDNSGKFHLVKCAEALQDLADIIGIKDKDVSFNGRLAMAFGARGHGNAGFQGAASAHYEPEAKVINLTKEGGAGSLAHEWGHALDNMMYQQSTGRASMSLASEGMGDEGNPAIKQAYKELMNAIMTGSGEGSYPMEYKDITYYRYHPSFKLTEERLGIDEAVKQLSLETIKKYSGMKQRYEHMYGKSDPKYVADKTAKLNKDMEADLKAIAQEVGYHHYKRTGEKPEAVPYYNGKSKFFNDSVIANGLTKSCLTSDSEMFARAFENYVQGKMKAGKVKNYYLVYGTWINGDKNVGFLGLPAPYPYAGERDKIHSAFDKLLAEIKSSNAIQKALEIEELEKSYAGRHSGEFTRKLIIDKHREKFEYPENPPEIVAHATGDYGDSWCQIWATGMDWNCYYYMINSKAKEPELIAMSDNDGEIKPMGKEAKIPKNSRSKAWQQFCEDWVLKRAKKLSKSLLTKEDIERYAELEVKGVPKYFSQGDFDKYIDQRNRNAYNVADTSEVFFIPINRLKTVYQTEAALDFDKIRENVEHMKNGENLEPVTIGYDYDIHDGQHRIEASKIMKYTHVPCIVGGSDEIEVQRAKEAYAEVWKSLIFEALDPKAFPYEATGNMFRGIGQKELDFIAKEGYIQSKGKGNDDDQKCAVTCFSNIFTQAEGYARSQYDLYHEKHAYVLAVERPLASEENELGEIEVAGKIPADMIRGILPITVEAVGLNKGIKEDIKDIDIEGEKKAILDYSERIKSIKDPKVRKIIAEILKDEENHKHNLKQILAYLNGDEAALDKDKLEKSNFKSGE